MPAGFGDDAPTDFRWGDDPVDALYFGDDLIWQAYSPPVVMARSGGTDGSSTTSHTITLPASPVAGELLLVVIGGGANVTYSTSSSGWTVRGQAAFNTGSYASIAVLAGIAGTAGALTVTTSGSARCLHTSFRIGSWSGDLADVKLATATGSASSAANPPSLTPGYEGASPEALWIVGANIAEFAGSQPITAAPAGYSNLALQHVAYNSALGTAELVAAGATQDPAVFTNATGSSRNWATTTISVLGG